MSTPPLERPDPVAAAAPAAQPEVPAQLEAPAQPEPPAVPAGRETPKSFLEFASEVLSDDARTKRAHTFLDPLFKLFATLLIAALAVLVAAIVVLVVGLSLHSPAMTWTGGAGTGLGAISTWGLTWLLRRARRSTQPSPGAQG